MTGDEHTMTGDGSTMTGEVQLFCASTLYGVATLAAAIDEGCFGPPVRRVLLLSNNSATPELASPLDELPGFASLRGRFDEVISWNETIAPLHPSGWSPRADDAPLWERQLRNSWRLGDAPVRVTVESIQVNPALALARIFTDAPIDVYADGLMSYGPTRKKLDPLVGTRVRRLLHLDLVPGLAPLLLTEFDVPAEIVPTRTFTKVLAELADASGTADTADASDAQGAPSTPRAPALLLGQYLAALGILTDDEEEELHLRMLRGAVRLGHRHIVFKPHPTAPARFSDALEKEAALLGAELTSLDTPVLAETLYTRLRPALVVGCFSTALLTAASCYGLPVARVGTELLLDRLTPYQNSNRVPVTIVDALLPELDDRAAVESWSLPDEDRVRAELSDLVKAVGFAMQPQIYPVLRPVAEDYLTRHPVPGSLRYFKRRRLTALALPGAMPAQLGFIPRNALVRRVAKRVRSWQRQTS
ncbi:polysialyltransferase family glycosyltransferase [Streptomyces sp. O3]